MKKDFTLTPEGFDILLGWLSADRNRAGEKYEEIRDGLIRFFRYRGCSDAAALADETINRVALKLSEMNSEIEEITVSYIYGFAANVYHEHFRNKIVKEVPFNSELLLQTFKSPDADSENKMQKCLEKCMSNLSPDDKKLIVKYYSLGKGIKNKLRKKMAKDMDIQVGTLHTRVHRIKNILKNCIKNCVNEK